MLRIVFLDEDPEHMIDELRKCEVLRHAAAPITNTRTDLPSIEEASAVSFNS